MSQSRQKLCGGLIAVIFFASAQASQHTGVNYWGRPWFSLGLGVGLNRALAFDDGKRTYQAPSKNSGRIVGYLYGWATPPDAKDVALAGYTHVIVAFAVFDTQIPGHLMSAFSSIPADYIKQLQSYGIKVLLSIGGASTSLPNTSTNFHDVLVTASSPDAFITNFISAMNKFQQDYGFDGFDFDIEQGFNVGTKGTFSQPQGDISVLAEIINTYTTVYKARANTLLTLAPQVANISATSGFSDTFGNYSSLIMQTCSSLSWVGIQLYNTGCAFGIDQVCYGLPAMDSYTDTDSYVAFAVDLLADWPATSSTGQATGFQPYMGARCLTADQVVMGFLVPNSSGAIDGGGPVINYPNVKDALNCLRTGTGCHSYIPPATYPAFGGVFDWSLNYDATTNYQFATTLSPCVAGGTPC